MGDYNINVNNNMGGRKSAAKRKLSAKGSIQRALDTKNIANKIRKTTNVLGNASSGSSSGIFSKVAGKSAVLGVLLVSAEKISNFGINVAQARTGNQVTSHNSRTTIKTISSGGMNFAFGAIKNELFTKQVISRQNFGNDYGREIYQINVEGKKNKRI